MSRINVYAEEMSEDVEIIEKETKDGKFTGLRLYLYLPVTLPDGTQARGKFMHHPGDDDSAAITFWGKQDLRTVLRKMLAKLDDHYGTLRQCTKYIGADDERCPEPAVLGSPRCAKHQ